MLVKTKKGVRIAIINDHLLVVCEVVSYAYGAQEAAVPVMTSAADGKHRPRSYHPEGLAWDFRTRGLEDPAAVAAEIRRILAVRGPFYDVVYGDQKHLDHIHIEFDRRRAESQKG